MNNIGKLDCFNFMRLVAAYLVVCGHMYLVAGAAEPSFGAFTLSGAGIAIFLSISGYLGMQSWDGDPDLVRYGLRRALRVFPALAMAVIVCAFALGPLVTTLPQTKYFDSEALWAYLGNIVLDTNYTLPGVFETMPMRGIVNTSLWTLPIGVLLYMALAIVNRGQIRRKPYLSLTFVILLCVGTVLYNIYYPASTHLGMMELHQILTLAPYFWVGMLLYIFRDRVDFTLPRSLALFSITALITSASFFTYWSWLAIPYLTISFAVQTDKFFRVPWRLGDFSYGIYLYSFPVQQALWQYYHARLPLLQVLALSIVIATLLGMASWALVEYPTLRLKHKIKVQARARSRFDFKKGAPF